MNVRYRFKQFFKGYVISGAILIAATGIAVGGQHFYYVHKKSDQIHAQAKAKNRERLWSEATNPAGAPNGGDVVDKFARLLNPVMVKALETKDSLQAPTLPPEIATATISTNELYGITDALGWCIFDTPADAKYCAHSGQFDTAFKTVAQDVAAGNILPYLHQVKPVTYSNWIRTSPEWVFLWWLLLTTIALGIGGLTVANESYYDDSYNEIDFSMDPIEGLKTSFGYTAPVVFTSPVVLTYTLTKGGTTIILKKIGLRKTKLRERKRAAKVMAAHPKPEALQEARDVLDELMQLDPKFRSDPDISRAIELAKKTVADIEAIPGMIALDEAKVQATEALKRLAPVKEDAGSFLMDHKALMSGYSDEMKQVLRGLPSAPKVTTVDDVLTDVQARKFIADKMKTNGNRVEM